LVDEGGVAERGEDRRQRVRQGKHDTARQQTHAASRVHEGRRVREEVEAAQHSGEGLRPPVRRAPLVAILGRGDERRDAVHHLAGRLERTVAPVAAQVALTQHGERSQAEFQVVTHLQACLRVAQVGPLAAIQQVGAGDVIEAGEHQLVFDLILDLLHARRAGPEPAAERDGDRGRRLDRQVGPRLAHLASGAGHGLLDPGEVERHQAPVASTHPCRPSRRVEPVHRRARDRSQRWGARRPSQVKRVANSSACSMASSSA
jgi:hypothetical protein